MHNTEKRLLTPLALHPTIFVIFGITGDLAARKLLPALLSMFSKRILPPRFSIIGFSRRSFSREEFRDLIRDRLNIRQGQHKEEDIKHFLDHISYEQGFFDSAPAYARLAERLKSIDEDWGQCSNKLFHLSVPPKLYEGILRQIADSGLNESCSDETGWTRILIEKPFGSDVNTARAIDKLLGSLFDEKQIFRIDHYLAKEAMQNILAFRFANPVFESLWSSKYIDKIHIKLFEQYEKTRLNERGATYDLSGALKDTGQNHILQMLALITMDRPKSSSASDIRRQRAKILEKLAAIPAHLFKKRVTRAQYDGYTKERGVSPDSDTETYFRLETRLNMPHWRGVPIYLENGVAMAETKTEIDVYFREDKRERNRDQLFLKNNAKSGIERQNILTFRIQPDECIKLKFFVKTPGYEIKSEPKTLKFKYSDIPAFNDLPNDYERLIRDAFIGDQTLFASTEEIMASWKFVTPIVENWGKLPLKKYLKGAREVE